MLNLIKHKKGKSKKERDREREQQQVKMSSDSTERQQEYERPSSRSSCRSERSDRSDRSTRSGRSKQPVLGVGTLGYPPAQGGLFDEDPGIMSEVETSSSRLRRGAKERNSYGGGQSGGQSQASARPRTSPSQPSRSPGPGGARQLTGWEEDPGIMSEAETSSTRVKRRDIATASLTRAGGLMLPSQSLHPQHSSMFDDDPGIMSEAETASTRRKNKPKAVLPVVRTPSKTLERPLGLVFLVYRGETKRALLPNEITTIDTVKALFVRSFGRALTMEYLDSPRVKIYIHDSAKDIFYELENLSEIRDRTILKLFETDGSGRGPSGLGAAGLPPFTPTPYETGEPFPSEPNYVTSAAVRDQKRTQKLPGDLDNSCFSHSLIVPSTSPSVSSTLPRNVFSSREQQSYGASGPSDSLPSSGRTMPGRSKTLGPGFMRGAGKGSGYVSSPDNGGPDISTMRLSSRFSAIPEGNYHGPVNTAEAKERMIAMEQQLSQISGMVQKALHKKPGKKSVSFEKSVSFSDDPPAPPASILSKKSDGGRGSHSSKSAERDRPTDRNSHSDSDSRSLERKKSERHSVCSMEPELYNQLRGLQKSARELRQGSLLSFNISKPPPEVRILRRLSQLQSMAMKDLVTDTYLKLREAVIVFATENKYGSKTDFEKIKITEDEDLFCSGVADLLRDLKDLEVNVEDIRSSVINKKNKISIQDVENLALMLSRSSKKVTELQKKLPTMQQKLAQKRHSDEQEEKKRVDKFEKEIPENLDNAWRRCRKVTGTLVTLKRLASVQEQRIHPGAPIDVSLSPTPSEIARLPTGSDTGKESSLDDLLDALQNYSEGGSNPDSLASEPPEVEQEKSQSSTSSTASTLPPGPSPGLLKAPLGRLPSYPSTEVGSPVKQHEPPPCPPRAGKGAPPPPPPRTSSSVNKQRANTQEANSSTSKSGQGGQGQTVENNCKDDRSEETVKMVVELTAASSLARTVAIEPEKETQSPKRNLVLLNQVSDTRQRPAQTNGNNLSRSESSSSDSLNSQDGLQGRLGRLVGGWRGEGPPPVPSKPEMVKNINSKKRQDELELRHQELLARQRQLQEQYQRLQNMQKKANTMTSSSNIRESINAMRKTGSDSSLTDIPAGGEHCNTLPSQGAANSGKVNGTKCVKFSTLPSPNKGLFNNPV